MPVVLLDGAARPGAKILVSGGSRCNVTNARVTERDFFGGKQTIIRRVLRALPVLETVAWFAEMGVALHEEEHGKLFPDSNKSRDVLDALLREVQACGVRLTASTRVTAITRDESSFTLETSAGPMRADRVVLATGGQSLPKSGSDGVGFDLARRLGHRIVPPTPALAPLLLNTHDVLHAQLSGVAHAVDLSVWVEGAVAQRLSGSLLWTHLGVSGPVVLDASRHWLRAQLEGRPAEVMINFCPGQSFDQVDQVWTALASVRPRTFVPTALAEFIPASVAAALLAHLGIDSGTALAHFTRDDRRRLARALALAARRRRQPRLQLRRSHCWRSMPRRNQPGHYGVAPLPRALHRRRGARCGRPDWGFQLPVGMGQRPGGRRGRRINRAIGSSGDGPIADHPIER